MSVGRFVRVLGALLAVGTPAVAAALDTPPVMVEEDGYAFAEPIVMADLALPPPPTVLVEAPLTPSELARFASDPPAPAGRTIRIDFRELWQRLPGGTRPWVLYGGAALLVLAVLRRLGRRRPRPPAMVAQRPAPAAPPAASTAPARTRAPFSLPGFLLLLGIAIGCGYGAYLTLEDASRGWTIWPRRDALKFIGLMALSGAVALVLALVRVGRCLGGGSGRGARG